jgi:hypothetical protein
MRKGAKESLSKSQSTDLPFDCCDMHTSFSSTSTLHAGFRSMSVRREVESSRMRLDAYRPRQQLDSMKFIIVCHYEIVRDSLWESTDGLEYE